jgi:hypothetical protein
MDSNIAEEKKEKELTQRAAEAQSLQRRVRRMI